MICIKRGQSYEDLAVNSEYVADVNDAGEVLP